MTDIKSIGVVGAGQMGAGIAQVAAQAGLRLTGSAQDGLKPGAQLHAERIRSESDRGAPIASGAVCRGRTFPALGMKRPVVPSGHKTCSR